MKLPTFLTGWITRSVSGTLNPAPWLVNLFGGTATNAGENVNGLSALQSQAVFACVDLISWSIASLPWHLQQGREIITQSPTEKLISKKPNPTMNAIDFRRALISTALTNGNGYALPVRRGSVLSALWLVNPADVTIEDTPDGQILYHIHQQSRKIIVTAEQIIHIKAFTLDGVNGVSPITYARETIGTNLAATNHLGRFFGAGAQPKGFISIAGTMRDPSKKTALGNDFDTNYGGNQSGKTAVLTEGAEYKPITTNNKDSQFIESQQWTVEEIARIFRVPPHKIGHLLTGTQINSIEVQDSQFIKDCLRPWIELLEAEFTDKLVNQPNQFIEIDQKALLRGDTETQVNRDVSYWNIGVLNSNEIREQYGLPPRAGGDEYFNPLNMANTNDTNNGKQERPDLNTGQTD